MAEDADKQNTSVNAKAILVDPVSMAVVWMNESARQDAPDLSGDSVPGASIDQAMPMAELLGLPEALGRVSRTGVARHLRTNLVSTTKGSVAIAASVYRLPDGLLLVLTENAWQPAHGKADGNTARRSDRRAR